MIVFYFCPRKAYIRGTRLLTEARAEHRGLTINCTSSVFSTIYQGKLLKIMESYTKVTNSLLQPPAPSSPKVYSTTNKTTVVSTLVTVYTGNFINATHYTKSEVPREIFQVFDYLPE